MRKLLLILAFAFPLLALSQQDPISLFQQFNGRYDFTAIGNTLNENENNNGYCGMLSESSATLNLEPNQTLVSAHLYWSSIGTGDFQVDINGTAITADRTFSHTSNGSPYFSAYADVTDLIAATGNAEYTFSGLDVTNLLSEYCSWPNGNGTGTNFGGWAIYIIYEDPALLLNQISLFDGLESVNVFANPINLTLTGINVGSDQFSKIGFLAWEGDAGIAVQESLYINDVLISDPPLNPSNNAFNGTNSYIGPPGNAQAYNMDLDFYDLVGLVEPGDSTIDIRLTSGQDWIMVNNIITSVNSELPDATIVIDNLGVLCQDRNIEVNYTVLNVNSTASLPANTPIAFYADAVFLGQTLTIDDIPIDGSESGTINLNIPVGTPQVFTLKAVVDDDGAGNGIVAEINEDNNEFEQEIDLSEQGLFILGNHESCEGQTETLVANFDDLDVYEWFFNGNPYGGNTPTIEVTQSGTYTVKGNKAACFVDESPGFTVTFNPQPIANTPEDIYRCDNGVQTEFFDLTQNDNNVLGTQDPTLFGIKYFTTQEDSENNQNEITNPAAYPITGPTPQTIYVRIHDSAQELCYDLTQFDIYYTPVNAEDVPSFSMCDLDESGGEEINLPLEFDGIVLGNQEASSYNISYHVSQDDANTGDNPLPSEVTIPVPGQTIYIRIEPTIDSNCFDTTSVEIIVNSPPLVNFTPSPLIVCDTDNDGFAFFNLHDADLDISLGDSDLIITYHPTL
ncbi:MAG TPA: CARDB domain-containing protein, partial [Aequorivita sp.]|nr:CARDB domain-containing protein [Aequorivita sp.]